MGILGKFKIRRRILFGTALGLALALISLTLFHSEMERTSTDAYCDSCHIHPQATQSWKLGPHYRTASGVVTHCVDCHLPPKGLDHYVEKGKAGARDLYGYYFKDPEEFDWEAISALDFAVEYTFDEACSRCHIELFPLELTKKGVDAHIHYQKNPVELRCVNCHLKTGHFHEDATEAEFLVEAEPVERDWEPLITELPPDSFSNYTDLIPGTNVKFEMIAIEGGTFMMGSSPDDPMRKQDETPQARVTLSPFWMGKFEVSWQEFEAYYAATATRGKNEQGLQVDAITGPTPPYGSPDQGWGRGTRPAITMSHYSARKYCEWLSEVTGRKYRLPTEAEWEYAAKAGTEGPFFFQGQGESPSWWSRLTRGFLGPSVDPELLDEYVWYAANSKRKSYPAETKKPNPFGLFHMLGNVKEFCRDWYSAGLLDNLANAEPVVDPQGPPEGEEHVVRGGSYKSSPEDLRATARDHTRHDEWLKTDPQLPKSVWWYSDSNDVGFRIVREFSDSNASPGIRMADD